jgi:hypothetical protein
MPRGQDTRSDPRRRPEGAWSDWTSAVHPSSLPEGQVVASSHDSYDRNYPRSSYAVEAAQGHYFMGRANIEAPDASASLTSGPVRTKYRAQVAADALQQRANGTHPDDLYRSNRLSRYL